MFRKSPLSLSLPQKIPNKYTLTHEECQINYLISHPKGSKHLHILQLMLDMEFLAPNELKLCSNYCQQPGKSC